MALNFPASPALDDTYTYGGKTWVWNGTSWASTGSAGPQGPVGEQGPPGVQGPQGDPGPTGTVAWADVSGKPATFPPESHTHAQSDIDGLDTALAGKLNTDFSSLTTRTIDGTETLALSGGLKATVQAVLNWILGRANTWTGAQTFGSVSAASAAVSGAVSAGGGISLKWKQVVVVAGAAGTTGANTNHGLTRSNIVAYTATLVGENSNVGPEYSRYAPVNFSAVVQPTYCEITYNASGATDVYGRGVSFILWYV